MLGKVVHCKKERYDVYIGRPSILGNPFSHLEGTHAAVLVRTREEAIERFREYATKRMKTDPEFAAAIRACKGQVLGCWCAPKSCHGTVILELAETL